MNWRDMTAEEIAHRPEARLGGALLWMTAGCTVAFLLPTLGMLAAFVALAAGGVHANPGGVFSWLDGPYTLGLPYMIPVSFFMIWSLAFVFMTLARLRSTPAVASAGVVGWVVLRIVLHYLGQAPGIAAADHTSWGVALIRTWPYAIAVLAELALAAGFCGYMATGLRPNAYYRRRLPAP